MHDAQALAVLEAAYSLSESNHEAMRRIAGATRCLVPDGPVAVARFNIDGRPDRDSVYFERADEDYISCFLEWHEMVTTAIRKGLLAHTAIVHNFHSPDRVQLPGKLAVIGRGRFSLYVMSPTGDHDGFCIMAGSPGVREWSSARLCCFQMIAHHLAVAWRIRSALGTGDAEPAILPAPPSAQTAPEPQVLAPVATAREVLRGAARAQHHSRDRAYSVDGRPLWHELLSGRWSVLDAFTAPGTRYVIVYRNPADGAVLRTLHPRERSVLELALDGRAGKWIGLELRMSESTVARTLHTALRRLGAPDAAALVGLRTARFEPLDIGKPGIDLAMAHLTPAPSVGLSEAERVIVDGILAGKRNAAIARERGTSPRTVSNQISNVYRKLGVCSRREVIALCLDPARDQCAAQNGSASGPQALGAN